VSALLGVGWNACAVEPKVLVPNIGGGAESDPPNPVPKPKAEGAGCAGCKPVFESVVVTTVASFSTSDVEVAMLTLEGSLDSIVEFKSTLGSSWGLFISVVLNTGLLFVLAKVGLVVVAAGVSAVVDPRVEVADAGDEVVGAKNQI
jgi:hypothetical protein